MIGVKTGKFEFADIGQLVVCGGVQSYIAEKGRDNPTTGLLSVKKNRKQAQYALESHSQFNADWPES